MTRKKLLFLSDAVSSTTGLGRITRDLAMRVHHTIPEFEVASVGYGGNGSVKLPWPQYHLHDIRGWLVPELPEVWNDFVGEDECILMCVWDMSRLFWLGNPKTCHIPVLRTFVEEARKQGKLKLWAYHAIDAEGPNGKVPGMIADTMKGFDRVLDYSAFSSRITGNPDHLPHGIESTVFYPHDRAEARATFSKHGFVGLKPDSLLVGIVATNQTRKNWQLGIETCRVLLDRGHDVRVWLHTDVLTRYWDIGSLVADYGLVGRVAATTQHFSDVQMAEMYSACDVTLGIGPEGFGFPIAESLACGTPCICGSYGAQAEYAPARFQVDPTGFYYEGAFCSKRPVHDPDFWALKVETMKDWHKAAAHLSERSILPPSVDWNGETLWPAWEKWFRAGL